MEVDIFGYKSNYSVSVFKRVNTLQNYILQNNIVEVGIL